MHSLSPCFTPKEVLLKLKGCVCYIFSSLVSISNREHWWNKEKCFLFHFTFRSWCIQMPWRIKCLNTKHILLNNLRSKHSLVIWPVYVTSKMKFFIKKFCENCGLEASSRPFLIFKESSVKRNLRRAAHWFRLILIAFPLHI